MQINELINLSVDVICIPLIFLVFRNKTLPRYHLFLFSILFILLSHFFTIVEGYILNQFFNFLEHFSLLIAAAFFLLGVIHYFLRAKET